jgi:hypothetical protein
MRPRAVSLLTGTIAALAAALLVAFLLTAGCGGRPDTPEALYERIAQLNAAGETGKIWDLLTPDAREQQVKNIEDFRVTLRKNPGVEGLVKQWKCTKDEFLTLSYVELYRRENLGNERAFLDAKITDKHADPRVPGDQILTVENSLGTTFYLRMRPVDGGWGLVQIIPRAK